MWRRIRCTMSGCAWMNASIWDAATEITESGMNGVHIHLRGLLAQERDVHLGEMRCHHHLAPHLLGRLVENGLPKRHEQLVRVGDTCLDDGPYFAAQDLGRYVRVPPGVLF